MGEQGSRQTGNERQREPVSSSSSSSSSSSRSGEVQQRQRVRARRARDDHGERVRAREATAARRARARGAETASVNEDKLYEHHEAIGGGAAARAPLRAVGRRCLPQLRMRQNQVELLAFGPSAPADGESRFCTGSSEPFG